MKVDLEWKVSAAVPWQILAAPSRVRNVALAAAAWELRCGGGQVAV